MKALLCAILLLLTPATAALAADTLPGLGQGLGLESGTQFLPADQAFRLSTTVVNGNTVTARWRITDGYYLYRDKFHFRILSPQGTRLGTVTLPPGKQKDDGTFGHVDVYYHAVQARLPIERADGSRPQTITLQLVYQGCADAGICYPPITKQVALALPIAMVSAAAAPPAAASAPVAAGARSADTGQNLSAQDRIARMLRTGKLWITLPAFFGFGLLLAFTPCIFPMVPILSGIIVGQGKDIGTGRAFVLSLVYVLAMAATYTVAGVVAALFGQNLQATLQNPWVLGAFALVFVLLALSMFGFYNLQLPSAFQSRLTEVSNRQRGGTLLGVGVMGLLSALIVGPCVAAPLAGALIVIGQTGDAVLGGLALFSLSLGMGAPLLVIGASAGKLLPKAGAWMDAVKAVFGVLLLAVAIYLLERVLSAEVILVMWAVLLITSAIYMGALDSLTPGVSGWRRLWKGLGLVLLLYGSLVMVGAVTGGTDPLRPLETLSLSAGRGNTAAPRALAFQRVTGLAGLHQALAAASAQGKPVMLDFYADWCISCKEMEKYTFSDPNVQQALGNTVLLQADVTAWNTQDKQLTHAFDLLGPPAILFFGPDGKERKGYRVVGFMNAGEFRTQVQRALAAGA